MYNNNIYCGNVKRCKPENRNFSEETEIFLICTLVTLFSLDRNLSYLMEKFICELGY